MTDFLKFLDDLVKRFPLHVEIGYNKIADWCIEIYKRGCADDYPNSPRDGNDAVLVRVQDTDMELAFARAHVELKTWLVGNEGGY